MSKTPHGFNRSTVTPPSTEFLNIVEKGDVITITLNRPEKMNALSIDLSREFMGIVNLA